MNDRIKSPVELITAMPVFSLSENGMLSPISVSGQTDRVNEECIDNGNNLWDKVPVNDYELPDWVKQNAEFGFLGEKLAFIYLEKNHKTPKWVSLKSSNYGYDIMADGQCYEVKTSQSKVSFEITSHEIKVAQNKKENFLIFFIVINEKLKTAEGYIIKNPLLEFDIDPNYLCKPIETKNVIFSPDRFRVTVEELIGNLERIDLSDIYYDLINT